MTVRQRLQSAPQQSPRFLEVRPLRLLKRLPKRFLRVSSLTGRCFGTPAGHVPHPPALRSTCSKTFLVEPKADDHAQVPAFMIIATVRGFLLNFGVYYATRAALGMQRFTWSPAIGCPPSPRILYLILYSYIQYLADTLADAPTGAREE